MKKLKFGLAEHFMGAVGAVVCVADQVKDYPELRENIAAMTGEPLFALPAFLMVASAYGFAGYIALSHITAIQRNKDNLYVSDKNEKPATLEQKPTIAP